ncbi:MAG: ATP-binding protein [Sulfuritalea sp.]|nr:ATP-binding protein [Sulfuritalea sp.]
MYPRLAIDRLQALATRFPAVVILGARQVGKTTLARQAFPEHAYVDLEDPRTRDLFADDPRFQLDSRTRIGGLIVDEAQAVPDVFAALRGAIDAARGERGRFVVLGSAQPALVRGISESLAGRVGLLELDPLTATEACSGPAPADWRSNWLCGGFPDALTSGAEGFREWHEAYLRAYIERDLPQLGVSADPLLARRLITMLAHQQGGLLNINSLANALGVSHAGVSRLLDAFEATFLLRRLPPWFRNVGKRLTKSPKVYLRDTGMLHHLLNIGSHDQIENHPVRGASWETFVLEDIIRRERLSHPQTQFYFWRTAAGGEIDLLLDRGDQRHAIEIKAGRGNARQGRYLADMMVDADAAHGWILDQGDDAEEAINASVQRRAFAGSLAWLP